MAKKPALNVGNLEKLGSPKLAEMLFSAADGNPSLKRNLNRALSLHAGGAELVASELRRRITSLRRARSFIDWNKRNTFARDLELDRQAIVGEVGRERPDLAVDLLWDFIGVAGSVFERVDDSTGVVQDVFRQAAFDLAELICEVRPDHKVLANCTATALLQDEYGMLDGFVVDVFPALGGEGAELLMEHLQAAAQGREQGEGEEVSGHLRYLLQHVERELADCQGDVDRFISTFDERTQHNPVFAAQIAVRLIATDRSQEALAVLDDARPDSNFGAIEWANAYIAALSAAGHVSDAQSMRWQVFEERLSSDHLRAYLDQLPDFDDSEAEQRAFDIALAHPHAMPALAFLVDWPAHDHAARFVRDRLTEIDGNAYWIITPAAQQLAGKHPLESVLLLRAMIEHSLAKGKSTRYRHAARHLLECDSLDGSIADYGGIETHEGFVDRIRAKHSRKTSFWHHVHDV